MKVILLLAIGLSGCAELPQAPAAGPQNRVVDIVNTSDSALHFYAVNASRRRVFAERFAEQDVRGNYYQSINFDDGSGACLFDFSAEFADGTHVTANKFNVCAEVSWVVNHGENQ